MALARPAGGAALIDALNARHAALWSAQYLDERLTTAREMLELATAFNDAERELQARNWLVLDLMEQGDIAAVRAGIEAHERLAAKLRLPAYTWWGPMWRATLAILEGRYADAEQLIAELAGAREPNAKLYAEIQTYALEWNRGRFDTIDEAPLERERGRPAEYAYRAGFAWVLANQGRPDEARAQIDWVAADGFARLGDDMNRLAALAELAQAIRSSRTRRTPPRCTSGSRPTPTATSPTAAARPATAPPRTISRSSRRCWSATPGRASRRRCAATRRSAAGRGSSARKRLMRPSGAELA